MSALIFPDNKRMANPKGAGRKPYNPNQKDRDIISMMTASGIPQINIGRCIGIDVKTMKKYYKTEMECSADIANAKVAQSLFQQAINGNTSAAIWWSKSRMGWKETRDQNVNVTTSDDLVKRINAGRDRVTTMNQKLSLMQYR
jgi:mannose-1-phosphate guanylyltransferase